MESECGLSEYANKGEFPPVVCELKRLYSDFIVNEILLDGALALPSVSEAEPVKKEEAVLAKDEPPAKKPAALTDEDLKKIEDVAEGRLESHAIPSKNLSKDERRETHEYIRNAYPRKLCSNGMDGAIVIKPHGSDRNDRKRQAWPNDRPDYLHFTLTKENKDTQYALNIISRLSGLNQKIFGTAGTKDRRAITSQRVSAYRVEVERLRKLNSQLRGMFLSNFEYAGRELKLGDLWGNRFSIVLRGIDESMRQDIEKRLLKWEETGFINYFGTQRFGSCGSMNVQAGRLILTQKWQEAVEAILQPRAEATGSLKDCLTKNAETKDAQAALKELKGGVSYASVEAIVLKSLSKQSTGYKNAIMALPRNMRSLYVHAYQSCVFNIIASRRARQFGPKVLEGDVNEDGGDLTSSSAIDDIALPLPSAKPVMPKNELAKWYEEIFENDGVTGGSFEQLQKEFAIGQVLRKFLERPRDVKWEFLRYTDRSQPLQPCLSELISSRSKPPIGTQGGGKKNAREPNGHDTSTRGSDDSPTHAPTESPVKDDPVNDDPIQRPQPATEKSLKEEAAEDDHLSSSNNVKTVEEEPADSNDKAANDSKQEASANTVNDQNTAPSGLALRVEFSLPAGTYATVALRELLRTDLSKAFQKTQYQNE